MNWNEVPQMVEPMTAGAYVGYSFLGIVALALLAGGGVAATRHVPIGLGLSAVGALLFSSAAFPFFRAAAPGWTLHTVAVWAAVFVLAFGAGALVYAVVQNLAYESGSWALIAAGGTLLGGIGAAALDWANESLASIPMSWAMFVGSVVLLALLAYRMAVRN